MNPDTTITISNSVVPHCQQRTASGRRCRMPVSDPESRLCFKHAAAQKKDRDAANLAATLIGDTEEFTSAVAINRSLGELYKLLARDEIAPRRAAVMAYTGSLLLRTLPAFEHELEVEEGPVPMEALLSPQLRETIAAKRRFAYALYERNRAAALNSPPQTTP
jgi:hypothetical protein